MINAIDLANKTVEKVRTPAIPYVLGGRSPAGTDCINLVGWCVEELGGKKADVPRGSNTAWRTIMQGTWTLREAQRLGKLVPGALVYICDSPTPQWPDGDYGHVGVYVGKQKGWAADQVIVHASASRGGVYQSTIKNAWTHVAWMKIIDYENGESGSASGVSAMSARVVKKGGSKGVNLLRVATSGGALNIRQSAN
ncbi:MAG: C40 family peptidase, partial [Oscillospiraceae bacterium]|nr:C40 family peptidase [Oscillospiraceae bacterium]